MEKEKYLKDWEFWERHLGNSFRISIIYGYWPWWISVNENGLTWTDATIEAKQMAINSTAFLIFILNFFSFSLTFSRIFKTFSTGSTNVSFPKVFHTGSLCVTSVEAFAPGHKLHHHLHTDRASNLLIQMQTVGWGLTAFHRRPLCLTACSLMSHFNHVVESRIKLNDFSRKQQNRRTRHGEIG